MTLSLTVAIGDGADDQWENETNNNITSYSSESNYDYSEVVNDGEVQNALLRFTNVTVPQGATIVSAVLRLHVAQEPGNDINLDVYSDVGANRQDAWSVSSRFETGFTSNSNGPDQTNTSTLTDETWEDIDAQNAVQDLVDLGGWVSGQTMRFAITPASYATGNPTRFKNYWFTSDPDNDFAPELRIQYQTGGGGGDIHQVLVNTQLNRRKRGPWL